MIPRGSEYIKCCVGPVSYKDFQAVNEDIRVMKKVPDNKNMILFKSPQKIFKRFLFLKEF